MHGSLDLTGSDWSKDVERLQFLDVSRKDACIAGKKWKETRIKQLVHIILG